MRVGGGMNGERERETEREREREREKEGGGGEQNTCIKDCINSGCRHSVP